jgi:hypothetical protein
VLVTHTCNTSYYRGKKSGGCRFEASLGKQFARPYLEKKKKNQKKGLVEWLKVQALSSNPSTAKK